MDINRREAELSSQLTYNSDTATTGSDIVNLFADYFQSTYVSRSTQ